MKQLRDITSAVSKLFATRWVHLHGERALRIADLRHPGVYLLAYSGRSLEGSAIKAHDVLYVGMSNSAGGVRSRLNQFKKGIEENHHHSGARRFFREHGGGKPFAAAGTRRRLYFSALTFECESRKGLAKPDDLRIMGHINCIEYYAIAHVAEQTGKNPPLNKLGPRPV
jgi:hypothetical protein